MCVFPGWHQVHWWDFRHLMHISRFICNSLFMSNTGFTIFFLHACVRRVEFLCSSEVFKLVSSKSITLHWEDLQVWGWWGSRGQQGGAGGRSSRPRIRRLEVWSPGVQVETALMHVFVRLIAGPGWWFDSWYWMDSVYMVILSDLWFCI